MANYLVVKNNNSTKSYECKSTHTAVPFVKVNSSYLDLTTETTAGLQYNVKINNSTYRPKQIYTTTTGYSGVISKSSDSSTTQKNNSSNINTLTNSEKSYAGYLCNGIYMESFLASSNAAYGRRNIYILNNQYTIQPQASFENTSNSINSLNIRKIISFVGNFNAFQGFTVANSSSSYLYTNNSANFGGCTITFATNVRYKCY